MQADQTTLIMFLEASLKQILDGVKEAGVPIHSFQLLDWLEAQVGIRVAVGVYEVIEGSVELDCRIVPAIETTLVSLLVCHLNV